MADIKVRVGSRNANKVISTISGGLQDGMVLVFNAATSKFEATLELTPGASQNLNINGGSF